MNTLAKPQNLAVLAVGIIIVLVVVVISQFSMRQDENVLTPGLFPLQPHIEPVNPITKVQAPWDIKYINNLNQ
jgi:hypothetical protein